MPAGGPRGPPRDFNIAPSTPEVRGTGDDMHMSTSKLACCAIALSVLVAAPAMAAAGAPTIKLGTDLFSTSVGTQADFTNNPLPADFFCTGSSAFSGSIPLTGVPLTTVPAGIAGSTDTVVQRLADGVFDTTGTA